MNEEMIGEINRLAIKPEKQKNKIINKLKTNRISHEDLLNSALQIDGDTLYEIGLMFIDSHKDVGQNKADKKKALSILEAAADKGAADVNYNCASRYFNGECGDLRLAEERCKKAIGSYSMGSDDWMDSHLLMAKILEKRGEYSGAIKHAELVTKDTADEKNAKKDAAALVKECFLNALKKLYETLNSSQSNPIPALQKMSLSEDKESKELKTPPGWHAISDDIDGFDVNAELEARKHISNLELQAAETADDFWQRQLTSATNDGLSKLAIAGIKAKQKECEDNRKAVEERKKAMSEYTNVEEKIISRQVQTEKHFFNPRRTRKRETLDLAEALAKRRTSDASISEKIDVTDKPARRMITAERSTVETSVIGFDYTSNKHGYGNKAGWKSYENNKEFYKDSTQYFSQTETVKTGATEIKYKQKINSHKNHMGDYKIESIGDYEKIIESLNGFTGSGDKEKEKQLATLMLAFASRGEPVTLDKLKKIHPLAMDADVNKANQIFYHCFVKEVARWMLPKDKDHELPLATAQARALRLIKDGHLSIKEVFGADSQYGVFTGTNIGNDLIKLREKIIRINALYSRAVLEHDSPVSPFLIFYKSHPKGQILPTRSRLHAELKATFGGDGDTDGEGYSSDDNKEQLYNKFKI